MLFVRPESDANLVGAVVSGRTARFSALVKRYQNLVYATILSRVGPSEETDDLVQETFLHAFSNLDSLQEPKTFGAWIRRIADNQATNFRRGQEVRARHAALLQRVPRDGPARPDEVVEARQMRAEVWRAIEQLSEDQREAVLLFYMEDMSQEKLAAYLGLSLGGVKSRLRRAREKLREALLEREVRRTIRKDRKGRKFTRKVVASLPFVPWAARRADALDAAPSAAMQPRMSCYAEGWRFMVAGGLLVAGGVVIGVWLTDSPSQVTGREYTVVTERGVEPPIRARLQRPLRRNRTRMTSSSAPMRTAPLERRRDRNPPAPIPLITVVSMPELALQAFVPTAPVRRIGPEIGPRGVQGEESTAEMVDLGMELLDVDALDTGQHQALVVVDPTDRKGIKGFLYLSSVYSASLERAEWESRDIAPRPFRETRQVAERRMVDGLARLMAEQTQVRAEAREAISLEHPALLKAPFVLFTAHSPFTFTEAEAANLGRYLLAGGFLYAEISDADYYTQASQGLWDLPALRGLIRAAFAQVGCQEGKDWSFQRLELDHPLFHSYYDIPSLPRGYWDVQRTVVSPSPYEPPDYIEGILMGERLVGVYSQKDYSFFWGDGAQRVRETADSQWIADKWGFGPEVMPCRLGVNVLVYALTREGSLAQRLVAIE